MKSSYRILLFALIFPMALGSDRGADTLKNSIDLDFLWGHYKYYTGCESPEKMATFQEIHAGYKARITQSGTAHINGGIVPMDEGPVDAYGGGRKVYGYLNIGVDWDWEYFGTGLGAGLGDNIEGYARFGSKRFLYADLGIGHRYPIASAGLFACGIGTGFGSDRLNVWVGTGAGLLTSGEIASSEFQGWSMSIDYRLDERFAVRLGGLRDLQGNSKSESGWIGLRYYFK